MVRSFNFGRKPLETKKSPFENTFVSGGLNSYAGQQNLARKKITMARLTIEKLRRHNRSHKLNHGTVYQQKVAGLELLERQYEKTGEKWIGRIIRKVLGCSRTYRCNSKYCPFCSNPRSVKAKRKIDDGSYQMP